MKKIRHLGLIGMLIIAQSLAYSQANSVELKDGTGTVISTYSSINAAVSAIPLNLTQSYIVELTAAYTAANETYPITISARTGASPTNTITIRPALGAGAKTLSSSSQIFVFNDADYVYIDGREGGIGNSSSLSLICSATNSTNTVTFQNGATFNKISYCTISHGSTTSAGRAIHFTTSSNPSGNSNNTIEYCNIPGGRYRISLNGTNGNENKFNTIRGCTMNDIIFVGIWVQANTGNITIDSCSFQNFSATGNGGYFILLDSQRDTTIIKNCTFKDLQNSSQTSNSPAIYFRSGVAGNCNSKIYNNFISFEQGNANATNLVGITFEGSAGYTSEIYNNTIKIGGTMNSVGTSGNVVSTCVRVQTTNASNLDFKNNLFLNTRTGGNAGVLHTCMNFTNTVTPITADYNTYNSTQGTLIRYGTTNYTNFANWQSFVPAGNELNSNTTTVQTVSGSDLHLTGASVGDLNLIGTPVSYILRDIDGQPRNPTMPYRGADEAAPVQTNCSGSPGIGTAVASNVNVCMNSTTNLGIAGIFTSLPDLTFQWQSSPDNITYTNISGATSDTYQATITGDIWFRAIVTCTTSAISETTIPVQVFLLNPPTVGGISVSNIGDTYTYTATGVTGTVTNYLWDLGNGQTSTSQNPSVTYTSGGPLTVTVTVSNACGSNTASTTVNVGCTGTPPQTSVLSNTLSACLNDPITLTLNGLTGSLLGYIYQWESSTDGTIFAPMGVPSNPTLNTTLTQTTYYRCNVTCANSNLSTISSDIMISLLLPPTIDSITYTNSGNLYSFSTAGITGNPTSYSWNFGNGSTSTAPNPTITFTNAGTYTVTLTITNGCGSISTSKVITVGCTGPAPAAQIISSDIDVCMGDPITLTLSGLNPQEALTYTYQWQSSIDGTTFTDIAGATSNTYSTTVSNEKFYRCVITCPQNTPTPSLPVALNLQFVPAGTNINTIVNGNTYIFSLGLIGNYTYLWDFGDGSTSTLTNPQHTYTTPGTYVVTVIVSGPCGNDTLEITITPAVSLENHNIDLGLSIYPNPTNDVFVIESNTTQIISQIKIIDILGKTVYIDGKASSLPLSISTKSLNLQTGIYFIEISSQNITNTFKLIVN